jgi:hypothetical protein
VFAVRIDANLAQTAVLEHDIRRAAKRYAAESHLCVESRLVNVCVCVCVCVDDFKTRI